MGTPTTTPKWQTLAVGTPTTTPKWQTLAVGTPTTTPTTTHQRHINDTSTTHQRHTTTYPRHIHDIPLTHDTTTTHVHFHVTSTPRLPQVTTTSTTLPLLLYIHHYHSHPLRSSIYTVTGTRTDMRGTSSTNHHWLPHPLHAHLHF